MALALTPSCRRSSAGYGCEEGRGLGGREAYCGCGGGGRASGGGE